MRGAILAVAGLIVALPLGAAFATDAPPPAQPAPAADTARGKMLFGSIGCSQCHGYVGQGGAAGLRLAGKPLSIEYFAHQLRHPVEEMPPYTRKVLSDDDVANILFYVKTLK